MSTAQTGSSRETSQMVVKSFEIKAIEWGQWDEKKKGNHCRLAQSESFPDSPSVLRRDLQQRSTDGSTRRLHLSPLEAETDDAE